MSDGASFHAEGDLAIDESFEVVRRARRWSKVGTGEIAVGVAAVVGTVLVAVTGSPVTLVLAPFGVLFIGDGWAVRRQLAESAGASDQATTVGMDGEGLEVSHPALVSPLRLRFDQIQAFATDSTVIRSGSHLAEYELFPIRRPQGSAHPLDEPLEFLRRPSRDDFGKPPVPLVSIDLGSDVPNVVLIFTVAIEIEVLAPGLAAGRGWVPPLADPGGSRTFQQATQHLVRTRRRIASHGVYLRLTDPGALASALAEAGLRHGLNCHDWRTVTGLSHPRLDEIPMDYVGDGT